MDALGAIFLIGLIALVGYGLIKFCVGVSEGNAYKREQERKKIIQEEENRKYMHSPENIKKVEEALAMIRRLDEEKRLKQIAEKKRKEEEEREFQRKTFTYTTIGIHKIAYRYFFYRHSYGSRTNEIWACIKHFKNGDYLSTANVIQIFLESNFTYDDIKQLVFCVIPAPTRSDNVKRYKSMCQHLANQTKIINGYDLITISYDVPKREGETIFNRIKSLSFSESVKGKNIILFDETYLTGNTFLQVANELKRKGAHSVYGLFIARTI